MLALDYLNSILPYEQGEGIYSHGDELLQMLSDGYIDEALFIMSKESISPIELEEYLITVEEAEGDQQYIGDTDLADYIHKLKRVELATIGD